MRILAIGAHPDDMDFFCGGTLARFVAGGNVVGVCSLTDGRGGGKASTPEELAELHRHEHVESAAILGAQTFWLGIPDGALVDDAETRMIVAEILREFRPDLLITHPPEDYHPDHVASSHLVINASYMARYPRPGAASVRLPGVVPLYFVDAEAGHQFLPDEYVDVTSVWTQKTSMLDVHRSQYEGWVNPLTGVAENWLVDRATVVGRFRGLQCGALYAEAFQVFRAHGRVRPTRLLP
jgi:LmbE family N-acetylglucosaminyl deacetylase